jgi:hypothetical protein
MGKILRNGGQGQGRSGSAAEKSLDQKNNTLKEPGSFRTLAITFMEK